MGLKFCLMKLKGLMRLKIFLVELKKPGWHRKIPGELKKVGEIKIS